MDKALKAKWLKALRSGKYKQGKYRLRNNRDEFCCLGVLCDVSDQGQWGQVDDSSNYCYYKEGESESDCLPSFMVNVDWARRAGGVLARLNDIDRLSFPGIANWIEENVPED